MIRLAQETLEAGNINDFRDRVEPVTEKYVKVVCDMGQVRFIDSMGCGLLISFLKQLQKKGGGLKICCVTTPVQNLFSLMNLDKVFGIFKTREEAIKAFK